jgi:hypothetical protein
MSAVKSRIRRAVKTAVAGLSLPGVDGADVVARKRLRHDPGYEVRRGIIVVALDEKEERVLFGGKVWMRYGVQIVYVQDRNIRDEDADDEDTIREAIRQALYAPSLAGVPEVFDCEYNPTPAFDAASFGDDYLLSGQQFDYLAGEDRNG